MHGQVEELDVNDVILLEQMLGQRRQAVKVVNRNVRWQPVFRRALTQINVEPVDVSRGGKVPCEIN